MPNVSVTFQTAVLTSRLQALDVDKEKMLMVKSWLDSRIRGFAPGSVVMDLSFQAIVLFFNLRPVSRSLPNTHPLFYAILQQEAVLVVCHVVVLKLET